MYDMNSIKLTAWNLNLERLTKIKGGQIARSPALTFGNGLHINISKKHG